MSLKEKCFELYKSGKSFDFISKYLSCSKGTISYHLKSLEKRNPKNGKELECKNCNKIIYKKASTIKENNFCSLLCKNRFWTNNNREFLSLCGKKSANIQCRRSKNETLFFNLCKNKYETSISNEPMFNGWDADVVIPELKVAILWNGNWHYKKLAKKHYFEKVLDRDRLKISEIENFGYTPYIIKDTGKFNEKFVLKKFNNFNKIFVT